MSAKRSIHCLYDSLRQAFHQETGISLSEFSLFQLLGGNGFHYVRFEQHSYPSYALRGNYIQYDRFAERTGVELVRVEESDEQEVARRRLEQIASRGYQLLFANCYYLPYDEKHYKQVYDNHMLIAHEYREETDEFIVSDGQYVNVPIRAEDLLLAQQSTHQRKMQHLDLVVRKRVTEAELMERVYQQLRSNAESFEFEAIKNMKEFPKVFPNIEECNKIFQKMAWRNIAMSIRHLNGPLFIRLLMSEHFAPIDRKVSEQYQQLSDEWGRLANQAVRLSMYKPEVPLMTEMYNSLVEKERACNENLLNLIEKGMVGL